MGTVQKLAEKIKAGLQTALPKLRKTVIHKLVLTVGAMIEAQTPNTSELANVLPVPTAQPGIREPWLWRLLKNPLLDSPVVLEPFTRTALEEAARNGQTVILSLDQTDLGNRFAVLMVALSIGIADELNLYAYVINSPSIKKDTFGLKGEPNNYACLRGGDKERLSEEKVRLEEARRKVANERQEIVQAAEALLKARDEGLVTFSDDKFDPKTKQRQDGSIAKQLKAMVEAPTATDLPKYMNVRLARIVQRVIEKAYERHVQGAKGLDFSIISLARPAEKETSPHKYGSAIDIGRYAGKLIDFQHGNDAVEGVAKFYEDVLGLEVGMAFGLPRNPKTDPAGAAAEYFDPRHPEKKRYYDLQEVTDEKNKMSRMQPVLKPEYVKDDFFFDRSAAINHSPTGEVVGDIKTFKSEIARKRFLDLQSKDQQNMLKFLFPDAWDHLHVQVAR